MARWLFVTFVGVPCGRPLETVSSIQLGKVGWESYRTQLEFCRPPLLGQGMNQTINQRYQILEAISRNVTGEVYRAKDLQTNQLVALKLLRPRFMVGENFGARLKQEFQVLRDLGHPNVVRVLEIGQTSDNLVYFAMELINGKNLDQLIEEQGALSPMRTSDLLDQIADALDCAHGQRVIHRNICPANILVYTDETGREMVKILDFGLAKMLDVEPEKAMVQTGAAVIHGNPQYISPEQAMGKPPVSKVSDVYSLGVTLFKMLVGRVPYNNPTEIDLVIAHVKNPVPGFREVNPDCIVSGEVETVVRQAMAKKQQDRPQSAGQLAKNFREALMKSGGGLLPGRGQPGQPMPARKSQDSQMAIQAAVKSAIIQPKREAFDSNDVRRGSGNNTLVYIVIALAVLLCALIYIATQ